MAESGAIPRLCAYCAPGFHGKSEAGVTDKCDCACHRPASDAASVRGVREGQIWNDRGTLCTVVSVGDDGTAVVKLETGERLPVRAGFFARAMLAAGPPIKRDRP